MRTVCASSATLGKEIFETIGPVTVVSETELTRNDLQPGDFVVTRSKTNLNAGLLKDSGVVFAGTCTAGIDHADTAFLSREGIHFASAPGCNANSVAEYVVAGLLELATQQHFQLHEKSMGIVGHGNVGKRVEEKARALGMKVLLNDPPLKDQTGDSRYIELDDLLVQCDILTLHVPLIEKGPHPTRDLISKDQLALLKPGTLLINACRGEVIPTQDLIEKIDSGSLQGTIIDVWYDEPKVSMELLQRVDIASPHIAGHSFEGKLNGTLFVYQQACDFLGIEPSWNDEGLIPNPHPDPLLIDPTTADQQTLLRHIVQQSYDIMMDDARMRQATDDRAVQFKDQRRNYRVRREFNGLSVKLSSEDPAFGKLLRDLGFSMA